MTELSQQDVQGVSGGDWESEQALRDFLDRVQRESSLSFYKMPLPIISFDAFSY